MQFNYFNNPSHASFLDFLAILISVISIFFTFRSIYFSKKIDLKFNRYEALCISNVNFIFNEIENLFTYNSNGNIEIHRNEILNNLIELNQFMLTLAKIYPNINKEFITSITDDFSDEIFSRGGTLTEFKSSYLNTKVLILEKLYDYAIKKEIKFWKFQ